MPITTHKPPESVAGWTAAQLIKRDVLSTAVRHGTITLAQAEVTRMAVLRAAAAIGEAMP